ncbi:MAG TPA: hypothetical protein VM346_08590 [Sphingomicrobium sp.]|nr:hypothetical protein [Sphingomicrobium sp.]
MIYLRAVVALSCFAAPSAASAATVVIYTDPMTMERRAVFIDPAGPAKTYLCMLPPAETDCTEVKARRR